MADEALRARVQALAQALGAGLIEREALVGLLLVALLAGENSLLLGPPGTAKSLLARRLALALREGSFFQVLLTRFTAPEELFGPVSLAALREHDRFERRTAGYLPEAHLALIDEVFKAGPAILNTLLMLLNERLFVNGAAVFPAPLLALVGASNEVPEDESLEALYDRFTLRLVVEPIAGEAAFAALLAAPRAEEEPALDPTLPLSPAEWAAARAALRALPLSRGLGALLWRLRAEAPPGPRHYVSDRRWRRIADLLRAQAWLRGRAQAGLGDLDPLPHALWNHPEDRAAALERVTRALADGELALLDAQPDPQPLHARWRALLERVREEAGAPLGARWQLRCGEERWEVAEDELLGVIQGRFAALEATQLLYDTEARRLVRLARHPRGGLMSRWGQSIRDERDLSRFGTRKETLKLEPGEVEARRLAQPGVLYHFGQLQPGQAAPWLAELESLRAEVGALRTWLAAEEARLRPPAGDRPGAPPGAHPALGRALTQGLRQADLGLVHWEAQMEGLRGAIEVGGRWATTLVQASAAQIEAALSSGGALAALAEAGLAP